MLGIVFFIKLSDNHYKRYNRIYSNTPEIERGATEKYKTRIYKYP